MLQIIGALIAGLGVGFCLGGLYEMRNTRAAMNLTRKIGNDWQATAEKLEKEWSDYCKKLLKDNEELQKECYKYKEDNQEWEKNCKILIQEYEEIIEGLRNEKNN